MSRLHDQLQALRDRVPHGTLCAVRLGDFYEFFADDAVKVHNVCQLTMTRRGEVPMCGAITYAIFSHVSELVRRGYIVALCSVTVPEPGKPGVWTVDELHGNTARKRIKPRCPAN